MTQFPTAQLIQMALQHHRAGRLSHAEEMYRNILATSPNNVDALQLLGALLGQSGRYDQAVELLQRAIALHPEVAALHSNLGEFYRRWGKLEPAVAAFQKAIDLKADYADAYNNLGITLQAQGATDQAIAAFQRAIALRDNYAEAHNNLGAALKDQGRCDEAIPILRRAIQLHPDYAEALHNLGNAYRERQQLDDAFAALQRAVLVRPNFADAHASYAVVLRDLGRIDESIAACRRALVLRPEYAQAHSNLMLMLQYSGEVQPAALREEAAAWQSRHAAGFQNAMAPHGNSREPDRRLRIGYISADFRQHSVAFFILPLLENRDQIRFHSTCYYNSGKSDAMTARIRQAADEWRAIAGLSDDEAAALIRADQIDILVDLAGHTAHNRLLVLARKPAPLQITGLGFPGPTGLQAIDYRLTDAFADPPAGPDHADPAGPEQPLRLRPTAWCFTPLSGTPAVSPLPAMHTGQVTFGTFNHMAKITPQALALWAQILQRVPGSRLLLKNMATGTSSVGARLRAYFGDRGISSARLELLPPEHSVLDHLERYRAMDMALDTFPYHGTTTTCEALWMGVPVITLAGNAPASRVGASLLANVGLPELVAQDAQGYADIAIKLANDLPRLADLREKLRGRMQASPLMAAPAFAAEVECNFRHIWRSWCVAAPL